MFLYTETDQDLQACIDACNHCYRTCLQMAMTHCLESGGKHVEADHLRADDELRGNLPDIAEFHAQRLQVQSQGLWRLRRNLRRLC